MDKTALFKITYGLYLAAVEYEGERCGCIINTASQATDTPCRILVTMQKRNHTTELVMREEEHDSIRSCHQLSNGSDPSFWVSVRTGYG